MVYRNKIVEPSYKDLKPVQLDDRVCALDSRDVPEVPDELAEQISHKIDYLLEVLEAD